MGFGDDLLVTSHAAKIKKQYPNKQIVIGNFKKKEAYPSIIYNNNPNITDCSKINPGIEVHIIDYHPENRPYIDYEKSTSNKYIWNKRFKADPGELFFSEEEIVNAKKTIQSAKNYWFKFNSNKNFEAIIFIETSSTKKNHKNWSTKHLNKGWGENNWLKLINLLKKKYLLIMSTHDYSVNSQDIYKANNMDFRHACGIMSLCDLYVGPEGGFSHVAGALKKNAVVYYGGWIPPDIIGYDFHVNLYYEHENSPCGLYRDICEHCSDARKAITVENYYKEIRSILSN